VNVGSTSRQTPPFLFFDACKERNFFKLCGSNHWLFLAYWRLGLHVADHRTLERFSLPKDWFAEPALDGLLR